MAPDPLAQNIRLDKVPPHDLDAEMAALGCALADQQARDTVLTHLQAEQFYHRPHQTIFAALRVLYDRHADIDLTTLVGTLRDAGDIEAAGGTVYLTDLLDRVSTTAHAPTYIKTIQGKWLLRRTIATCAEMVAHVSKSAYGEDPLAVYESAASLFDRLDTEARGAIRARPTLKDQVDGAMRQLEDRLSKGRFYSTGIAALDQYNLIEPGIMTVLSGRADHGKTALGLYIALELLKQNVPCLLMSTEMMAADCIYRFFAISDKISLELFHHVKKFVEADGTGALGPAFWDILMKRAGWLQTKPLALVEGRFCPADVTREIRALKRASEQDFVFVFLEAFQSMTLPGFQGETRERLDEILKQVHSITREQRCSTILASHLTKAGGDLRPTLSDPKGTGELEYEPDRTLFIFWPWKADGGMSPKNVSELKLAKNKTGPTTGWFPIAWLPEYQRFGDLRNKEEEEGRLI